MRLSPVVVFLSWSAVFCLLAVGDSPPGILVRLSEKGIRYAAKKVMEWVDVKIDRGMRFPDQKGTFSPSIGTVKYLMTEIQAKNFSWHRLNCGISAGAGVMVSFHKITVTVIGSFSYNYTVAYIPFRNNGTFNLMLSDVSLFVNATAGMGPDGQPTVGFSSCSASIGNIDIEFKAETANWILNFFIDTIKSSIKPTLIGAICDAVKNGQTLIAREIARNVKPCVDRMCNLLIDLQFVVPPVFGKDFVETAHRGRIFWEHDATLSPFEPLPFQRLPLSSKMVDLYVDVYVLNSLMFVMHQNDLLSYEFTKDDLPLDYRNFMNTSCENFCIGKVLPDVFNRHPGATVELDVVSTRAPFLNISDKSYSIVLGGNIKMQTRKADGSVIAVGVLTLEGSVSGSAFTNNEGKIAFTVTDIRLVNAEMRDKEAGTEKVKESKDLIAVLRSAAMEYLLPKLNEIGQKGLSKLSSGKLNARSPSLMLIQNALVLMTDVIYTNATAV